MNYDPETGTPYGYVSMNSLEDRVWDILYNGRNLSEEEAIEDWRAENPEADDEQEFWDYCEIDEPIIEAEADGVQVRLSWLGGAAHLWVFKSPHVASCRACSPCAPGAGDLDSKCEPGEGIISYDLPPDWYRKENPLSP